MPGVLPAPPEASPSQPDDDIFHPRNWAPLFEAHTSPTRFITLPPGFVDMLSTGSVYLPDLPNASASTEVEWSDGTVDTVTSDPTSASAAPRPAGVEAAIEAAIAELGGAVSPKLGTVCPTDAVWANFHRSTKCTSADDVLTLLQASERVLRSLQAAHPAVLVLRAWADFDPRQQFRVFASDGVIVGLAHRAADGAYARFSDARADALVAAVCAWHERHARAALPVERCVLDVRVGRGDRIVLVDLAPWRATDPLLFDWDELEEAPWMADAGRAQFRAALRDGVVPGQAVYDGLPIELRGEGGMAELASAAQRLVREQEREAVDEDKEDEDDGDRSDAAMRTDDGARG